VLNSLAIWLNGLRAGITLVSNLTLPPDLIA